MTSNMEIANRVSELKTRINYYIPDIMLKEHIQQADLYMFSTSWRNSINTKVSQMFSKFISKQITTEEMVAFLTEIEDKLVV